MNPTTKAYLKVHIATLLYGLTAILGDLISLNAVVLVWWRVVLASLGIVVLVKVMKIDVRAIKKSFWTFSLLGLLIAFHWITFYGAIKLSNASLTLICFSTTSLFSSLLEPLFNKVKINFVEVLIGLLIIPFIILIANTADVKYLDGMLMGIFSAFLVSLFGVLNKIHIKDNDSILISGVQLGSASVALTFVVGGLALYDDTIPVWPSSSDWMYLFVLAFLCTTFAFIITTDALKKISAFATALIINLEPVYGIILAYFILDDSMELAPSFYFGAIAITMIVFSFPLIKKRLKKKV